ncbi:MAG: GNAT family N-acetyltransferase, partial [Lachnospiraceae bacterium]|nr:GNAT family N-acetyltransferase [Lachnospiraceae bacterium]
YGIFENGEIAGFIGCHGEGSIGMLYIDEKYRHKGYAADLESFMFNRDLEHGRIPYGQVVLGNEASVKLQEKIGVYGGDKVLTWLHL